MNRHTGLKTALAAVTLAACSSGDSGTGPATPVVTTIQVTTSAAAILVGDTAVATATVKDQNGAVMNGQAVTWSVTVNGGAATITGSGILTAGGAGTAIVTATAAGKTGSANVAMGTDDRFGYAWADQQGAATYAPDAGYTHNSSGAAITITRASAGVYAVRFAGLAATGAQRTGVQVTAYGSGSNHCKSAGWSSAGADLVVEVRCFTQAGVAADSRYTVLASGATALGGRLGFAYADNAAASAVPVQARSSRAGGIRVERTAPGQYSVVFDGLKRLGTDLPEMTMVTAIGDGSERCTIPGWGFATFNVSVRCVDPSGSPVDSKFSIMVMEQGRPGRKLGFAWANDAAAATYEPHALYRKNDGGGAVTVTRLGTGSYSVNWAGFTRTSGSTETVLVAGYGGTAMCRIGSWGSTITVSVVCYDTAGALTDTLFNIVVVQ